MVENHRYSTCFVVCFEDKWDWLQIQEVFAVGITNNGSMGSLNSSLCCDLLHFLEVVVPYGRTLYTIIGFQAVLLQICDDFICTVHCFPAVVLAALLILAKDKDVSLVSELLLWIFWTWVLKPWSGGHLWPLETPNLSRWEPQTPKCLCSTRDLLEPTLAQYVTGQHELQGNLSLNEAWCFMSMKQ